MRTSIDNPYITFRDGPTGPRAALIDGPDIWEVVQTLNSHPGGRGAAIRATAEVLNLAEGKIRTAIVYYATNADEIDARLEHNARPGDCSRR